MKFCDIALHANIADTPDNTRFQFRKTKQALSLDATLGTHMGPRSPNTVFSFLHRRLGEVFGFNGVSAVKGGMSTLSQALASAATANGVEIRTAMPVSRINSTTSPLARVTPVTSSAVELIRLTGIAVLISTPLAVAALASA
jgi:phytoene dehydrogenase-like protein